MPETTGGTKPYTYTPMIQFILILYFTPPVIGRSKNNAGNGIIRKTFRQVDYMLGTVLSISMYIHTLHTQSSLKVLW